NIRISQGGTVSSCTGEFTDAGGAGGNHSSPGQSQEITLCPSGGTGTHIELLFSEIDLDGTMTIFNGPNNTEPILTTLTGADNGIAFRARATAGNGSGCLTIRFENNGSTSRAGWVASINCVAACQPIEAVLVSANPAPQPDLLGYIDICPGTEVTFSGRGNYPENGDVYNQSDATSTFTWNFQDGTVATGQTVTHTFEEAGGYAVQLLIEDNRACRNSNRISQRVRVAPPPIYDRIANIPTTICVNDEVPVTLGNSRNPGSIEINPVAQEFSFNTSQTFSETTRLPDGTGVEYSSPLLFSNFNPGQTLEQSADLVRICAVMEHSYLGDLDIWIQCPNGNRLDLLRYIPGNDVAGQELGQADKDTNDPDIPGTYCWTASAPRTMTQAVTFLGVGDDEMLPSGDYAFEGNVNALVGCDLNGEWSLHVQDNLPADNGTIFEWSIEFANDVYPDQETFSVPIQSLQFVPGPSYRFFSIDSVVLASSNPGPRSVVISSIDEFFCTYDTTIVFNVAPPFDPACSTCGPLVTRSQMDTSICRGENFTPNVARTDLMDTVIVWEATLAAPFSNNLYGSSSESYNSLIDVTAHSPTQIADVNQVIESVCLNLENAGDLSDITIELVAPNGRSLTLLENFGGNGEDLSQTCFSPTATMPLSSGTAPYTGTFQATGGGWTAFNTSNVNGSWQLRAWDAAGNDVGQFISWNMSLRYDLAPTYQWTPNDGSLSCVDCPSPTITPTAAGTYTLNVTTANGCTDQAIVTVDFNALDIMVSETITSPSCPGQSDGEIDLTVTGSEPSYNYLWEDGSTTQDRNGLAAGSYQVTITDSNNCRQEESFTLTDPNGLSLTEDDVIDVSCNGGSDGQILVTTSGGTPPYSYLWDDPNAQIDEDAGALTQGTYTLVVTDSRGCTARLTATVDEPLPITITFRNYPVSCRNGDDGRAVAVAAGGNGGYTFSWQTGASQDSISGLASGPFDVTVMDQQGCMATATTMIDQPADALTATVTQTALGCFDTPTNAASVAAMGGTTPYRYNWSNLETSMDATALPAGPTTVTVTDANNCEEVLPIDIDQHPEVTANLLATSPSCNDRTDGQMGAAPIGGVGMNDNDYTFQWSTGESSIVITNLPGNTLYRLTVTDPIGCSGEVERFLAAPPRISLTATELPVDCFGNSTGGLTISNITGPNLGNFNLQWSVEANFSTNATIANLPAGDNYGLQITDNSGCTLDTLLRISQPPELVPNLDKVDVACFGDINGSITAIGTGGAGSYQYAWSTGSNQNQIVGLAAGDYSLSLSDANGCETITSIPILEPAPITISAVGDPALCEGEATGVVTVTGGGGRPPFVYSLENRGFSRNNVFVGLPAEEYSVFVRDSAGCQISTNVIVNDGPVFGIDLGPDSTIIFGDSILLSPMVQGGVGTLLYDWTGSYGGTLSCVDCPTPMARPEYEIDYSLRLLDENGCVAEDRLRISVRKIREVAVPSGFSPNDDNRNDRLLVHGRPGTQVLSFSIFDRWGNVLFEDANFDVNDPNRGWDGTHQGQPVNAGVYIYRLLIRYDDDSEETLAGETSLIR
ncbi:MAG: proprotein convertase P-domain-containing protein, partial [Bacteroidota bacterium]